MVLPCLWTILAIFAAMVLLHARAGVSHNARYQLGLAAQLDAYNIVTVRELISDNVTNVQVTDNTHRDVGEPI